MSSIKWGSLKSGKLNIVKLNHESNKEQKDDGCSTDLTKEENSNVDLTKNDELTESCTLSKKSSDNNINSSRSKSTNDLTPSSSRDCDKFFIPSEIYEIYRAFAKNVAGAKEIVEYYLDSSSSDEENCVKSSDLSSDSLLFNLKLPFKKESTTCWKKSVSRRVKKCLVKNRNSDTSLRKTEILSSDEGNESPSLKQFSSNCSKKSSTNIKHLSKDCSVDTSIESNRNSENLNVCETQNSPVKERDGSTNTKLEISFAGSFSQKYNSSENNSEIDTIFLENDSYINAQNHSAKGNNIESISEKQLFSDSLINASCDISTREIDRSPCNEEDMGNFKARNKVEVVDSTKSSGSDDSSDKGSNTVKLDKKSSFSLNSTQNTSDSESSSVGNRHSSESSSDTENVNKKSANNKSNLSIDLNKRPRKEDVDEEDNSITSLEKNKQININSITEDDKQSNKNKKFHDLSSCNDSDTSESDRSDSGTLALDRGKNNIVGNYGKNKSIDKRKLDRTNSDYVIKLSSDNESDSDHSSESKTSRPVSNRTSERHVSVSSNESDLGNPDVGKTILHLKENELLNQIEDNLQINFNKDFLKRNEVWLVQCPKNMDVNNIKGQSLNVPNRTVVHDHGCKYECYVHHNEDDVHQTITLAIPYEKNNFSLSVVPVKGNVIFEEKLDVPEVTSVTVNAKRKLPLPEGLKCRHPLLGLDYHHQPSTKISESKTTYKEKKKHKKRDSLALDSGENEIQIEPTSSKKKKKRKSKNTHTPISNGNESDGSLNYVFKSPKKNKRKRSDSESLAISSVRENVARIDDLTSKSPKKKKKRSRSPSQVDSENYATVDDLTPQSLKKKKKSHKSESTVDANIEQTEMSLTETPKTTKKKRKRSDSMVPLDASYDENAPTFEDEIPKKKKKKSKSRNTSFEGYDENAPTFEDEIPKKKKKKSKSRNTSFEEEAEAEQLDIETSSSKKKKKHIDL